MRFLSKYSTCIKIYSPETFPLHLWPKTWLKGPPKRKRSRKMHFSPLCDDLVTDQNKVIQIYIYWRWQPACLIFIHLSVSLFLFSLFLKHTFISFPGKVFLSFSKEFSFLLASFINSYWNFWKHKINRSPGKAFLRSVYLGEIIISCYGWEYFFYYFNSLSYQNFKVGMCNWHIPSLM